jgi:hypothetical protein
MAARSPSASVLLGHGDHRAVRADACRAAGVGEKHEGEQPGDLPGFRQEPVQQAGEPDRLG